MNIYIGNLNFNLVEDELKEIFEEYGEVTSVRVITDKFSGRSKGFGFIEMADDSAANNAIENLNGSEVGGRNIKVSVAQERQDRGDRRDSDRRRDY